MEFEVDVPTITSEELSLVISEALHEKIRYRPPLSIEWYMARGLSEELGQEVLNFLAKKQEEV